MEFDPSRAWLKGPDFFPRFVVPDAGVPLSSARRSGDELIVVVPRGQHRRAFLLRQLGWHHMAQGRLAGTPYLATF